MNETNTPQDEHTSAAAARRLMGPDIVKNRITAGVIAGAVILSGAAGAQAIGNEIDKANIANEIDEEGQLDADILKEINEKATSAVDPASIVGIFDIAEGSTIYSLSVELAHIQPEYQNADAETQELIDVTIRESGIAQGPYSADDTFVISRTEINGKDTLIVQNGDGLESQATE